MIDCPVAEKGKDIASDSAFLKCAAVNKAIETIAT